MQDQIKTKIKKTDKQRKYYTYKYTPNDGDYESDCIVLLIFK